MEILGSMLRRTWNNNNDNKTLNNNDDDDLSSWEIIINPNNNNTPHDHDHDHDHDHVLQQQQQQQHGLSLSTKNDIDRPRLNDNVTRLVVGSQYDHTTNMVSDELEPFRIDPSSSTAFTHPFPIIDVICDSVCNRRLDHEEEDQVHHDQSINYDDVEDADDDEYDYDYDDDDDSRWLGKQRMTKVGKKVNNGMMKKSNKLPRYFYNKFV